jgi:hypothetical protein
MRGKEDSYTRGKRSEMRKMRGNNKGRVKGRTFPNKEMKTSRES